MEAVVAALVGMGEDWQAVQVWARLKEFYAPEEDDPMRTAETVDLTVEAVNPPGRAQGVYFPRLPGFCDHGTRRRGVFQVFYQG